MPRFLCSSDTLKSLFYKEIEEDDLTEKKFIASDECMVVLQSVKNLADYFLGSGDVTHVTEMTKRGTTDKKQDLNLQNPPTFSESVGDP